MVAQRFMRRGTASNATARRLIASAQQIAPSALKTMVELGEDTPSILCRIAYLSVTLAGLHIERGQYFNFVASPKFAGYYYILARKNGEWFCSSPEASVKAYCIGQVEAMEAEMLLASA